MNPPATDYSMAAAHAATAMATATDDAIVLRLYDYSESSQIAVLFSRQLGLARVLAKGARRTTKKQVKTGLDLLELGEAAFRPARGDAGLGTLIEWRQIDGFSGVRVELERLYAALYATELVGATTAEHDPHPELFDALRTLLAELSTAPAGGHESLRLLVRFQASLLRSIGYAPSLRACVSCGRPRVRGTPAWFSSRGGGLLCRECEPHYVDKRSISPALLDAPRGESDAAGWVELLDFHLSMIAGRRFAAGDALLALPRFSKSARRAPGGKL